MVIGPISHEYCTKKLETNKTRDEDWSGFKLGTIYHIIAVLWERKSSIVRFCSFTGKMHNIPGTSEYKWTIRTIGIIFPHSIHKTKSQLSIKFVACFEYHLNTSLFSSIVRILVNL